MKYILIAIMLVGCSQTVEVPVENKPKVEKVQTSLTMSKLETIFYTATRDNLDKFYDAMQYAYYFGIKDKQHEDMYLATVSVEVGSDLVGVRENLNYSCSALPSMFSYYRDNGGYNEDGRCNDHSANQVLIGNKIYANRIGNGSVSSGDGYMFRGGGYAQTTGRYNYQVIVDGVNAKIGSTYTEEDFANNIHKTYIAQLGGLGYWYQVDANSCSTMDCVTDKWNYHTDSRQERNDKYEWISEL